MNSSPFSVDNDRFHHSSAANCTLLPLGAAVLVEGADAEVLLCIDDPPGDGLCSDGHFQ